MVEVFRNKNLATRFQILVEIADKGPFVQQRSVARQLKITPQAVSDYVAQLVTDGMLEIEGRSRYRLTGEAVNWIIKILRELDEYNTFILRAINNIAVCPAVAETDLQAGTRVTLKMKNGLLYASAGQDSQATGITVSSARQGEDIGITGIAGIVPLTVGSVSIIKIPGIDAGGSGKVDCNRLKVMLAGCSHVFALGTEAYVALTKTGTVFQYYGAVEGCIEASRSGLSPVVVCVAGETSGLITRLDDAGIDYRITDISGNQD